MRSTGSTCRARTSRSLPSGLMGDLGNNAETRATDQFCPDTHLLDAVELYLFDKKLRLLVVDALERIGAGQVDIEDFNRVGERWDLREQLRLQWQRWPVLRVASCNCRCTTRSRSKTISPPFALLAWLLKTWKFAKLIWKTCFLKS